MGNQVSLPSLKIMATKTVVSNGSKHLFLSSYANTGKLSTKRGQDKQGGTV